MRVEFPPAVFSAAENVKASSAAPARGLLGSAVDSAKRFRPDWWADARWPVKAGYGLGVAAPVALMARVVQRQKEKVPSIHAPEVSFAGLHEGVSGAKDLRNYRGAASRIANAIH